MKITLKKAISATGKSIKELDLDLDSLTGNDLIEAEKQVMVTDNIPVVMDFNRSFLISVAARASKIPADALKSLSAKDFSNITNTVQRFLTGTDSGEAETAEIPEMPSETSSVE